MAGVAFSLHLDDIAPRAGFAGLRHVLEDPRPMLEDIGMAVETSTVLRFATNLAPDGTPWKTSMRAELTGSPTLVDGRLLRDSIHYEVEPEAVEVGSAVEYASIHQTGGVITAKGAGGLAFHLANGQFRIVQSVTMPARPYLGLSAEDGAEVEDIAIEHLAAGLAGRA